jgi:hypothetical protein
MDTVQNNDFNSDILEPSSVTFRVENVFNQFSLFPFHVLYASTCLVHVMLHKPLCFNHVFGVFVVYADFIFFRNAVDDGQLGRKMY